MIIIIMIIIIMIILLVTFWNHWNLFGVYLPLPPPPPDNFYRENHISRRENNSGKLTWAPFEKYSSYATVQANRLCIFAREEKSEHHLELFSCLVLLKYSYVIFLQFKFPANLAEL